MRRSCDTLLRLSPAIDAPSAAVAPVNGVADAYFALTGRPTAGAYFIGKLLWAKGFDDLIALSARLGLDVDVFGEGDDADAIRQAGERRGARLRFRGRCDDPALLRGYRVLINLSRSEVLCTTTAEALAMNKWVVAPAHPSNEAFARFSAALLARDDAELDGMTRRALAEEPPDMDRRWLGWEAATERLLLFLG